MKEETIEETEIFICECHSLEHQVKFWHETTTIGEGKDSHSYDELSVIIHLQSYQNFFKRLWVGIRYAFGYTSRFGDWDDFLFKKNDAKKLREYLNTLNLDDEK